MAAQLTAYIRAAMRRSFTWGKHDCALFAADWVKVVTGADCAEYWRGRYDDEAGAQEFMRAGGGLVAMFDKGTAGTLKRCEPDEALVGVILVKNYAIGAVRSGASWVVLGVKSFGRIRADKVECLAAWGVS